jgi:glucose uptake protein GlcU
VGRAVDSMVGTRFGAVVVAVIVWCVGMREAECEVIGVKG